MKTPARKSLFAIATIAAFTLAGVPSGKAADFTWLNGASVNWNLNGSWVGGAFPPVANTDNDVFFNGNTTQNFTFLGATRNVRSITFGSTLQSSNNATFDIQTATSLNTGSANLVFDAGVGNNATVTVENNASALAQIQLGRSGNGNVILTSNLTINHNDADSAALLFDGVVTGAGTITKNGVGRIRLLRGNTAWSGGININQGEVDFSNVPGSSGTGTIRLGETASANNVILRFGGNGGAGNYANNIVVSSGDGNRTIQRFNSPNGVGISTVVGNTTNTVDLSAGKSLVFDIQNFGANNDLITLNSSIFGSGGVVKSNTGRLILAGTNNTYTGGTTISGGTVALSGVSASLGNATNTLTVNTGGTLNLNAVSAGVGSLNGTGGSIANSSGSATLTIGNGDATGGSYAGAISSGAGTLALTKVGTGTQTLTGNNTYTGATAVSGGTLSLARSGGESLSSTASVTVSTGATLLLSQSDQVNNSASVTLSGGTIRRDGNVTEVFGALNLTVASFLDYGAGAANTLRFGTYTPTSLLTVQNFAVGNKLQFGNTISAGDLSNPALFSFSSAITTGTEGGFFTITAIPETSTYVAALGLAGLMLWPVARKRILG
jgi:fibronectin-binding autotransporter adhesin